MKQYFRSIPKMQNSRWFAVLFCCFLLGGFIILTSEVKEALSGEAELIGVLDQSTLNLLIKYRNPVVNELAINLTALGSSIVLAIVTFFIGSYFLQLRKFLEALQLFFVAIGSSGLTWLLKFYFERSRPSVALRLVEVDGFSYPSGHSLSSTAIYFTIAIVMSKILLKRLDKIIFYGFFLFLILGIGITRIYLGVHFFSDVVAGILVGLAWASLVEILVEYSQEYFKRGLS